MKRIVYVLVLSLFASSLTFAGGIQTNTNQSAAWVRMLVRDASLGLDAVYYNPAGLTFLEDGFFLSLNSQSIVQNKLISTDYQYLPGAPANEYEGKVTAPVFPGVYTGYKMGKLVISLGVNPIGGGGGATFETGLPSFEYAQSELVPKLSGAGVTAYSMDAFFEGTSVFWGVQLGASYEINDMFSVYLGGRYVMAKNTYVGHLRDVMVTQGGTEMRADALMSGFATNANGVVTSLQPLVDGGAGGMTLDQAEAATLIDATTNATLTANLVALGIPELLVGQMDITTVQGTFQSAADTYAVTAIMLGDQEGDIAQKGAGITPIIGVNIKVNDKLNIGLKYEGKTDIELENETAKDLTVGHDGTNFVTMFPDGAKSHQDMPAMFSIGAEYKINDKLSTQVGYHQYFDKAADYGKTEAIQLGSPVKIPVDNEDVIDAGSIEWAIGFEYKVNEKLIASIGYLGSKTGVTEAYQTDLSYSLNSNTVGFGGQYSINEMIDVNIGFAYTTYADGTKTFERLDPTYATGAVPVSITETYSKDNLFMGIGIDFKF